MRWAQLRCFWRWRFGHRWEHIVNRDHAYSRCRECRRTKGGGFRGPSPTIREHGPSGD